MAEVSALFEPLRFPGDDYVVRMNASQVLKLCTLMYGIKQSSPKQFQDPDIAMLELQLAHQSYLHNLMHGKDDERAFASGILPKIREKQAILARFMGRSSGQ
jgi:hypothetical protein